MGYAEIELHMQSINFYHFLFIYLFGFCIFILLTN